MKRTTKHAFHHVLTNTNLHRALLSCATVALFGGACAEPAQDASPVAAARAALTVAPVLYATSDHESPVRGDPGDLLLLAGTHFDDTTLVVYQWVDDTMNPPSSPSSPPIGHGKATGTIKPIARDANAITVHLPDEMIAGQSYELWAVTPDERTGDYDYSNPVLINDARPMWISPGPLVSAPQTSGSYVYTTAERPGIGRDVKIMGRNLQHGDAPTTRVRLSAAGLASIVLDAAQSSGFIDRYEARITLPSTVPLLNGQATTYSVAVSRDGTSWVPMLSQITVLPDPPPVTPAKSFFPESYSDASNACDPCDGADDMLCITRAIHAASDYATQTGRAGNVVLRSATCPGGAAPVWTIATDCSTNVDDGYFGTPYRACDWYYGIPVPANVNLLADPSSTNRATIETEKEFEAQFLYAECGSDWTCFSNRPHLFRLFGNNIVEKIRFHDAFKRPFDWKLDDSTPQHNMVPGSQSLLVAGDDITVDDDFFDDVYAGVDGNPAGNRDIVVRSNVFGAWYESVALGFVADTVVSNNTFYPGGYERSLAVGVLSSQRLDLSGNIVDGTVATYSAPYWGWRAGFFLPQWGSSHEDVLIAQNQLTCIGTRDYRDGEAISTDSNGDYPGTKTGTLAIAATPDSVTIDWPGPSNPQSGTANDLLTRWLRVDYGAGLGQARKITSVRLTAGGLMLGVSPSFDVVPEVNASRVIIGNEAWQMNIVDNTVDNTCARGLDVSRYSANNAGAISLYGGTADVALEGNHQVDTAGLAASAQHDYWTASGQPDFVYQTPVYFLDIRSNTVEGMFGGLNNRSNTFGSGIDLRVLSGTKVNSVPQANPNDPGFGVCVAHNTLIDSGLVSSVFSIAPNAGIALEPLQASDESSTPGYIDTLVFSNSIDGSPRAMSELSSAGISNGCSYYATTGSPNYPQTTILCQNKVTDFFHDYTDCPGPGQSSTIVICP